jgi:hypothetical protein
MAYYVYIICANTMEIVAEARRSSLEEAEALAAEYEKGGVFTTSIDGFCEGEWI